MEANRDFFDKLRGQIAKKSIDSHNVHGCVLWTGAINGHYGRKKVRYPDGTVTLEYVCRVVYMCKHRVINIPAEDADGETLDVSHLCHNHLCVSPHHLVLEKHSINMDR